MLVPLLSVCALLVAIVLSVFSRMNVGFVALAFAYALGVYGLHMRVRDVGALFPANLFLTCVGLTLLFGHAKSNGTLDRVAGFAVQLARGRVGLLAPVFFLLGVVIGTIGAGNIGAVALLAPIGMAVASEAGVSPFLMAMMIACGGNATAFTPMSPTGVIAIDLMARIGLVNLGWQTYAQNLLAHALIAFAGYLLFGGLRLLRERPSPEQRERLEALLAARRLPLAWQHGVTLAALLGMLLTVALFRTDVGVTAFAAAILLAATRASDEEQALRTLPWGTILMVCGMTVLMSILEKTGGIDLCTRLLVRLSTVKTAPAVLGLSAGVISAYSSSSGVVLPALLPTIPSLIQRLGGGDPVAMANSINVGAHLVDVSPLSTLGALCLAHAAPGTDVGRLYRQLLMWGLCMAAVGAVYCHLVFGVLGLGSR